MILSRDLGTGKHTVTITTAEQWHDINFFAVLLQYRGYLQLLFIKHKTVASIVTSYQLTVLHISAYHFNKQFPNSLVHRCCLAISVGQSTYSDFSQRTFICMKRLLVQHFIPQRLMNAVTFN